ncbi:hypothetical protein OAC51_09340 [Flavobacteriaceae bacterium]|nr:hypothetical protein [Flavobacteriaceae bacterium]
MKNLLLITFLLFFSFSFAQEITKFSKGLSFKYYENDSIISKKYLNKLMSKNEETDLLWKKYKKHSNISNILFLTELAAFITLINLDENQSTLPAVLGLTIYSTAISSIVYAFSSVKNERKAILRYNSLLDEPPKKKVVRANLKLAPALILDSNRINGGIGLNLSW